MQRWVARCAGLVSAVVALVGLVVVGPATSAEPPHGQDFPCLGKRYGQPRALPAAARQGRVAERVAGREGDGWSVRVVRPTHLGVVALVGGDVDAARAALPRVDHVISWTGGWLDSFPPSMRMYVAISRFLEPVMRDAMRRTRGWPGRGTPGIWVEGTAAILTWKAPVPARVQRLAGVRANGVELRIVPRPYSEADLRSAQDTLRDYLDEHGHAWVWLGTCRSDRGLELGVPGRRRDLALTDDELAEIAGMPVQVWPGSSAGDD
jgi:hypothetical protein